MSSWLGTRAVYRTPSSGRLILFRQLHYIAVIGSALFVGIVYILTLAPSVTGEDSGELITAAYFFGVPHPPGYPIWTLLCGLWTHILPIGTIAWRANSFSALCSMLTVAVIAATLCHMRFRPIIAGCAAAATGLSATVWSQSVITEVYSLFLLFLSLLCYCVWRWSVERTERWLFLGSIVFGLGMANHHLIGFAGLALVLWGIYQDPRLLLRGSLIFRCVVGVMIGLVPYWYLLWAGGRDVPVNWGETGTLHSAWQHITRGQYKSDDPVEYVVPMTTLLMVGRLYYALRWIINDFTPLLLPILIAGIVWLYRRRSMRRILGMCLVIMFLSGPVFLWVGGPKLDRQDQFVQKVFLTPLAVVLSIPMAAGLQWIQAALRPYFSRHRRRILELGVTAAVLCTLIIRNGPENDMRHYWFAYDHAQNLLACMQPGAMFFPSGDHNTFPMIYLIHVEKVRPDVIVADKYGYIDLKLYNDMPNNPGKPHSPEQRDDIERWIITHSNRPIYYTVKKPSLIEGSSIEPAGLVYSLTREPILDVEDIWRRVHYRNLDKQSAPIDYAAVNILADYHYALATYALQRGQTNLGIEEFRKCTDLAWGIKEIFNNVGSALAEYGQVEAGIGYYESASRMDWTYGPARWNLAKIFKASSHFEWSAKVFEDLTKAAPKDFRPYGELGFLYRDQFDKPDRARAWWYESLRLNPRQAQIIDALYELNHPTSPTNAPLPIEGGSISQPNPASQPASRHAQSLAFSNSSIDLGEVIQGKRIQKAVVLSNTGTDDLTDLVAEPTCSCISIGDLPKQLKSGRSATLQITFAATAQLGEHREAISIHSQRTKESRASLGIHVNIVAPLQIDPAHVQWEIYPGESLTPMTVKVHHRENVSFSIEQVTADSENLKLNWSNEARPDQSVEISSSWIPSRNSALELTIHTSNASEPIIKVPLTIRIRSFLRATPALAYFGRIEGHEKVERNIIVELQNEKFIGEPYLDPIEQAGLSATIANDGKRFQLAVSVDPVRMKAGAFMEVLRLRVKGFEQVLEVPIHGFIASE
jgi:tetratricopeptide (TPR) repeat protein